jgi:hypothetical protein
VWQNEYFTEREYSYGLDPFLKRIQDKVETIFEDRLDIYWRTVNPRITFALPKSKEVFTLDREVYINKWLSDIVSVFPSQPISKDELVHRFTYVCDVVKELKEVENNSCKQSIR